MVLLCGVYTIIPIWVFRVVGFYSGSYSLNRTYSNCKDKGIYIMITVNSISGGKTSSYIAVRYPADYEIFSLVCINEPKARPKDRAVIDYVNGKIGRFDDEFGEFIATAEDDKTLKVMMDLEQMIGREIIWVRGKSFDNVIDNTGRTLLPNKHYRYCTEEMKLLPIFLWWWHNIHEKVNMRIGFRFCEVDRMERFFQ